MTRVLYWNIENFAVNKIQNPGAKRKRGASISEQDASAERLTYISRHVTETDPDIFIVVEVETPYNNNRGVLCGGGGQTGCLALLGHLQALANWCLVPPLITGNKEAVAVFFRADRVTFTGPDQWGGGVGPTLPTVTPITAQAYPAPWNTCLPVGNYSAARVQFPGMVGMPPANVNFGVDVRHPYQTTFLDAGGRTINIFTVHAPANFVGATAFLQTMTTMAAIDSAGAANELRLVLGDFNLTLLRVADSTYTDCYAPFTSLAAPYTVALAPAFGPMPDPLLGYAGYFATHIRPTDSAICWSDNQANAYYPGYFFVGDSNGAANASIDNVLYLAGAGGLPAAAELTVINGLVGSPYSNAGANPGGCPEGTQAFNRDINWQWAGLNPQWVAPMGPAPDVAPRYAQQPGVGSWFQGWNVYGKIRSTSDHLPLFFNA